LAQFCQLDGLQVEVIERFQTVSEMELSEVRLLASVLQEGVEVPHVDAAVLLLDAPSLLQRGEVSNLNRTAWRIIR
jgi:hypothetical protein